MQRCSVECIQRRNLRGRLPPQKKFKKAMPPQIFDVNLTFFFQNKNERQILK